MNDYILMAISLIIGFAAIVLSSRKNGFILGYGASSKDKYRIDKDALGSYGRAMFLIIICSFMFGLLFSQDATVFVFTAMNTFFIGYALAWEKVIKLK